MLIERAELASQTKVLEGCPICGAQLAPRGQLAPFCSEACETVWAAEQAHREEAFGRPLPTEDSPLPQLRPSYGRSYTSKADALFDLRMGLDFQVRADPDLDIHWDMSLPGMLFRGYRKVFLDYSEQKGTIIDLRKLFT